MAPPLASGGDPGPSRSAACCRRFDYLLDGLGAGGYIGSWPTAWAKEALGQTSDQSEYVYLSDGGHFENLGLYEMVRRRCGTIVVLDGGCDPDFHYDDLGNALRKIRIDLRIPIDFDEERTRPLKERRKRCAVGTIRYSAVDGPGTDGRLVYVKPMLLQNEGPDIASYAAAHPAFPHQGTGDQWFDESQTESYRSLGLHTSTRCVTGGREGAWPTSAGTSSRRTSGRPARAADPCQGGDDERRGRTFALVGAAAQAKDAAKFVSFYASAAYNGQ